MEEIFEEKLVKLSFPTSKPHVSFSEVAEWTKCPFKHKLKHIDKIDLGVPAPVLDFGTAVHAACEHYIKTREMDLSMATNVIIEAWQKNENIQGYKNVGDYVKCASFILNEVPKFLETNFPNWSSIEAEEMLYETIENDQMKFKGYIDAVIKVKDAQLQDQYWLLDWKTTSWGWKLDKKRDFMTAAQLVLYKVFWSIKHDIPLKNIRCGFVLLKKDAKDGSRCELFPVSVGPKSSARALKLVSNMLSGVRKGLCLKNRNSCTYCEFNGTEHCH